MPKSAKLVPYRADLDKIALYYGRKGRQIRDLLLSIKPAEFSELASTVIQVKVNKIIKDLNRYAIGFSQRVIKKSYLGIFRDTRLKLQILKFKKDPNFDLQIHKDYVKESQDLIAKDLLKANESIRQEVAFFIHLMRIANKGLVQIQAFDLRDEKVISNLLDKGIKAGDARGKVQKNIKEHFKKRFGDAKFININGRNYDLKKYSKMVARTRIRVVQSDAVENTMKQYDADLVRISSHMTSCASGICQPFEGRVYSLFGKTPGYPVLTRKPPFHPNCEHSMNPTSLEAIKARKRYKKDPQIGDAPPKGLTSLAEMEAKLKALGIDASLTGLDLKIANVVYKEIIRLMKKYKGALRKLNTKRGIPRKTFAQVWASKNMDLSLNWFADEDKFLDALKKCASTRYHPKGIDPDDLIRSVVTHEYGHTIFQHFALDRSHPIYRELKSIKSAYTKQVNKKYNDLWDARGRLQIEANKKIKGIVDIPGITRAEAEPKVEAIREWHKKKALELNKKYEEWMDKNYLSDYAKENIWEFFSEGFNAFENQKIPIPVAKEIGDFSKKQWGNK